MVAKEKKPVTWRVRSKVSAGAAGLNEPKPLKELTGSIKRVQVPRLGHSVVLPPFCVRVTEGPVAEGDVVWWETCGNPPAAVPATSATELPPAQSVKGWRPASEPVPLRGQSSIGSDASLLFCVARPKPESESESESDDSDKHYACARCGRGFHKRELTPVEGGKHVEGESLVVGMWCPECVAAHAADCAHCGAKTAVKVPVTTRATESVSGGTRPRAEVWCPVCADDDAKKCVCCGKYHTGEEKDVLVDNMGTIRKWCGSCVGTQSSGCGRCSTRVAAGVAVTVDGTDWCPVCSAHHSRICSRCGLRVSATHPSAEDPTIMLCGVCDPVPIPGRSAVHGYHGFGGGLTFYGAAKDSGALFIGFELEAGGATTANKELAAARLVAKSDGQKRFHLEHDGSIPQHGFELISAPMTLAEHKRFNWLPHVKMMAAHGLRSHDLDGRCGLHVHVSRNFLSNDDCARIDLFILKNKRFWEFVARRKESSYAKFDTKPANGYGKSGSSGRYSALNFTHPGTVEFRLFRGTLRFETLMATLEICDGVCNWIKTRDSAAIMKNHAEIAGFVKWMKDRKETYAEALEYILRTKAYIESTAAAPEL